MSSSHPEKRQRELHELLTRVEHQVKHHKQKNRPADSYLRLAAGTYLSPSCSPAFLYCPPPLSRGPEEPAGASFCAAGV